jgi:hypothetical protein
MKHLLFALTGALAVASTSACSSGQAVNGEPVVRTAAQSVSAQAAPGASHGVTRIRYFPRAGQAERMKGGRFTGSNEGATTDFSTIAEIKEAPKDGEWNEIALEKPALFRWMKYEAPRDAWGNVAEVEFYAGDRKLTGTPFGTNGSRDGGGNDFAKALDGDTSTFFDAVDANSHYVGIDLGAAAQVAPPKFSPEPGSYKGKQTITISSPTPGAKIRYRRGWGGINRDDGEEYKAPITLEAGEVVAAVAYTDGLASSPVTVAAYRIGGTDAAKPVVRTFHIGNSLTDTTHNVLEPLAQSAGKNMAWHRFTIPGAPTDWLWDHPGSGFGDNRYTQAFFALAPIAHVFTQPFAGHGRSIENEAEYSQKFFDEVLKSSPEAQAWLYVQWPDKKFGDGWASAKNLPKELNAEPATTWQEGVDNHVKYTEAVRDRINKENKYKGKPVRIVPAGLVLARLKTEIEAGRVPGMTDFFAETFSDDLHLNEKGRYAVALAHYAAIFGESPEGRASALNTKFSPEQLAIFQRVAWETVKGYKGAWPESKDDRKVPAKVAAKAKP